MSTRGSGRGIRSVVLAGVAVVLVCLAVVAIIWTGRNTAEAAMPTEVPASVAGGNLPTPVVTSPPLTASSSVEDVSAKMVNANCSYGTLSATYTSGRFGVASGSRITIAVQHPNLFSVLWTNGKDSSSTISDGDAIWHRRGDGEVEVLTGVAKGSPKGGWPDRVAALERCASDSPALGGPTGWMLDPRDDVYAIFPHGLVRIVGTEDVGGREGVVVEVVPDPARPEDWAIKWGSRSVYVVDARTGILLRQDQYNRDGGLEHRDLLSDVVIDSPDFSADFTLKLAPGEKLVYPGSAK